jgi:hypothetical protein
MSETQGYKTPTFIIDSRLRLDGSPSSTNFDIIVSVPPTNEYDTVSLISAHIPKTFYTVGINNEFRVLENGTKIDLTLPSGNYNNKSFAKVLKKILDKNSVNNFKYFITFPDLLTETQTEKFTFTILNNPGLLDVSFVFFDDIKSAHHLFGFEDNTDNPFSGNSLVSSNAIMMQLTKYIQIKSNICNNYGSQDPDNEVLIRINCHNVRDGASIDYHPVALNTSAKLLTNNKSNRFTFSLFDDHNRLINLNGLNWSCRIILYKKSQVNEILTKTLQLYHLDQLATEVNPSSE